VYTPPPIATDPPTTELATAADGPLVPNLPLPAARQRGWPAADEYAACDRADSRHGGADGLRRTHSGADGVDV
jgi:hypothetical protein